MRIAVIIDGIVDNIIEADSIESARPLLPAARLLPAADLEIGWKEVNGTFAAQPRPFQPITAFRFKELVRATSAMTATQSMAWSDDTSADARLVQERLRDFGEALIDINQEDVLAIINHGLNVMKAGGHTGNLAPAAFVNAVLAAWPRL